MLEPIQSVDNMRHDDLQKIVTAIVHDVPTWQIFIKPEDGVYQVLIIFEGPIALEKKLSELVQKLLDQLPLRATYTFAVTCEAGKPIQKFHGMGLRGFAARVWDRNCQLQVKSDYAKKKAQSSG